MRSNINNRGIFLAIAEKEANIDIRILANLLTVVRHVNGVAYICQETDFGRLKSIAAFILARTRSHN